MAVWARISADALQQLRVTGAYAADSQQSDGLPETDAPRGPDGTTVADTSHKNGPSVDFRTGAELAYHRSLEQGGPFARAEGKQPKKNTESGQTSPSKTSHFRITLHYMATTLNDSELRRRVNTRNNLKSSTVNVGADSDSRAEELHQYQVF
ncbi:hypothetical protein Q7P35_002107 [Cladosporium inversicolor]